MTHPPWPVVAVVGTVALLAASSPSAQKPPPDKAPCDGNPVFERFAGETLRSCERARFKELTLYRRVKPEDPRSATEVFRIEGEYWHTLGDIAKDGKGVKPSPLEVQRNFENAVHQAGGQVLNAGNGRVVYRVTKGADEFTGEAGCGGSSSGVCNTVLHRLVRTAGMQQSVVVSAEQIGRSLGDEGKVVFYGIFFDTDKAVLKPDSAPTLEQMAHWLKANAAARVFIVGHTDLQGAAEHNQALSRNRAAAVVDALVRQHGVAADRLGAQGVGPFAPVASNASEAGRAKNRRVEMVLR